MRFLVTGFPRSGTTFMGRGLSAGRGVHYVEEPFNSRWPSPGTGFRAHSFWRPDPDSDEDLRRLHKLDTLFSPKPAWPEVKLGDWARPSFTLRRLVKTILPSPLRMLKKSVLVKDPLAVCSADILARRYGLKVIVMIREPLDVIASIARYGWRVRPDRFTRQSSLRRFLEGGFCEAFDVLAEQDGDHSRVLASACSWHAVHRILAATIPDIQSVKLVRHSDVIRDPQSTLAEVLDWLEVDIDSGHRRFIDTNCREHAIRGQSTIPAPDDIRRNTGSFTSGGGDALPEETRSAIRGIVGDLDAVVEELQSRIRGTE